MIFKVRTVAEPRGEEKHCEGREADGDKRTIQVTVQLPQLLER